MAETLRVRDEFTGAAGTALEARAPSVLGDSWTAEFKQPISPTTMQITVGGTIFPSATRNSERVIYSAQPNPSGPNQRIQATIRDRGPSDDPWILFGRADSGNWANGYGVAVYAGSTKIYKKVSGVVTQLGSSGAAIGSGSVVSFAIVENALTVTVGATTIASATDTDIFQNGRWGLACGNLFVTTDDIDGQEFDSFFAYDVDRQAVDATAAPALHALSLEGFVPDIVVTSTFRPPSWRTYRV